MIETKQILLVTCILLVTSISTKAQGWRGIVPLHSTRADVDRLLGPPVSDDPLTGPCQCLYPLKDEIVHVSYANGLECGQSERREPRVGGWKVPRDTVVEITVRFRTDRPLSDFKIDERYKKETDEHSGLIFYTNLEGGVRIEGGKITVSSVSYFPAANDHSLRCPDSTPKKPFDRRPSTGWRSIVPLRSTRTDVERELGSLDLTCQCYETERELVRVRYATGPCAGDLPGWNVPRDTVLSITVSPKKKFAFSEVETRKEDFVKTSDDTFTAYYANGNEGLRYSVTSSGFVKDIAYLPSIRDNPLRCAGFPLTDGGITAYAPYYEFPYASLQDITSRLGEFSIRLHKQPDYKGYLVVYAGCDRKIAGVAAFANKAKNYLIDELKTDPKAVEAINGGYRDQPTIELFLIPNSWPPPVPTPTFAGILR